MKVSLGHWVLEIVFSSYHTNHGDFSFTAGNLSCGYIPMWRSSLCFYVTSQNENSINVHQRD